MHPSTQGTTVQVATNVTSTSIEKTTKVKSHRFREFRHCKKIVTKARKLKLKIKKTFRVLRGAGIVSDSIDVCVAGTVNHCGNSQFSPRDTGDFFYDADVYNCSKALYDSPVGDAVSSNRILALSLIMTNVTAQTSVAAFEFQNRQKIIADFFNKEIYNDYDEKVTSVTSTLNQFSPLFFKRLMYFFGRLQEYYPTYLTSEIKLACVGEYHISRGKWKPITVEMPNAVEMPVEVPKIVEVPKVAEVEGFVAVSEEVPVRDVDWLAPVKEEEDEGDSSNEDIDSIDLSQFYALDSLEEEVEKEEEEEEEEEEFLDFIVDALRTFPDYRKYNVANGTQMKLKETEKVSVVEFSDFDQLVKFHSDETPLALSPMTDSESDELRPLKSCLKRIETLFPEIEDVDPNAVQMGDAWFEDVCARFVEATNIRGTSHPEDDEYWEDLETFMAVSQMTFLKLGVGINEMKVCGVKEFMAHCEWTVKLSCNVFYSYLAMANRYEVVLDAFRHVNDLWSLNNVRNSLLAERKHYNTLKEELNLAIGNSKFLANDLCNTLDDYADDSRTCVSTVKTVVREFEKVFNRKLVPGFSNFSVDQLKEMCGKTDFDAEFGQYVNEYLFEARSMMKRHINEVGEGAKVLELLDASLERALTNLYLDVEEEWHVHHSRIVVPGRRKWT